VSFGGTEAAGPRSLQPPEQHQVNQPKMAEVVRHLVDEEWLIGAIRARVSHVTLAKSPEMLGRELGKYSWIARVIGFRRMPAHPEDDTLDVEQFMRAIDLLADVYVQLDGWEFMPPNQAMPKAKEFVNKASTLRAVPSA
jgi:hypothetical protein